MILDWGLTDVIHVLAAVGVLTVGFLAALGLGTLGYLCRPRRRSAMPPQSEDLR